MDSTGGSKDSTNTFFFFFPFLDKTIQLKMWSFSLFKNVVFPYIIGIY